MAVAFFLIEGRFNRLQCVKSKVCRCASTHARSSTYMYDRRICILDFLSDRLRTCFPGCLHIHGTNVAANGPLNGILGVTDQPNVSMDFNHDPRSSIFHLDQTKVMDGNMCRVLSWYDNEWGFSNRMADTAVAMGKLI